MAEQSRQPLIEDGADEYELLDFGNGRKLERFGPYRIDRPCPAADEAIPHDAGLWRETTARYARTSANSGTWNPRGALPAEWRITVAGLQFLLKPNAFGHLGIFPEQRSCWEWIESQVEVCRARTGGPARVLNLFAYTGGSTMAAARGGAIVTHVDAARNVVLRARENFARSSLPSASVRWIADDARRFVQREVRRGNRYEALIIDPPTYGHGARGERWKLDRDLPALVEQCARLASDPFGFALVTCHTPGWGPKKLGHLLASLARDCRTAGTDGGRLQIAAATGRCLAAGYYARWPGGGQAAEQS